jgi:hypothetical protein
MDGRICSLSISVLEDTTILHLDMMQYAIHQVSITLHLDILKKIKINLDSIYNCTIFVP